MRDKLNENANRFNEQTTTVYVISRVNEETFKHILIYRLQDFNYFKNPRIIFDVLHDIYANFERQKNIALIYDRLKQDKNQKFESFYATFMLYIRMLTHKHSEEILIWELKNKVNIRLRKMLVDYESEFNFRILI